jgi:hypothetical protein
MSNRTGPDTELTPAALEVFQGIEEDTRLLRETDLDDVVPAAVFEAR